MFQQKNIRKIFDNIYITILISATWFVGFILGFGLFSLIPTTITSFRIIQENDEKMQRSFKVFMNYWWNNFRTVFRANWKVNLLYMVLMGLLFINYLFLKMSTSFMGYFVFYITIFLFLFMQTVFLWFCYIRAKHMDLNMREALQNALFIPASRLVEMIIVVVLMVALYLLLWEFIPGLVVFVGSGLGIFLTNWIFTKILEGFGINKFKLLWERMH